MSVLQECAQNFQSGGYFPLILKLNSLYFSAHAQARYTVVFVCLFYVVN